MNTQLNNLQCTLKDGSKQSLLFSIQYSDEQPQCVIENEENKQIIKLDKVKIPLDKYSIVLGHYIIDMLQHQQDLQIKQITFICEKTSVSSFAQFFTILDASWQTQICEKLNIQKIMHNGYQCPELLSTFLLGAQGDAMGYKYQFQSLDCMLLQTQNQIQAKPQFIVSDDTQLSIYTFISLQHSRKLGLFETLDQVNQEYMIRVMFDWLKDWFASQSMQYFEQCIQNEGQNRLSSVSDQLCNQRAPGNVTLSSISNGIPGTLQSRINTYRGNGAVSRVAPIVFILNFKDEDKITLAAINAAITHGSDEAIVSCAFEVALIQRLSAQKDELLREWKPVPWKEFIIQQLKHAELCILKNRHLGVIYQYSNLPNYIQELKQTNLEEEDPQTNIYKSLNFYQNGDQYKKSLLYSQLHKKYGTGWNADSCLAIAIYALLHSNGNFNQGMCIAINNNGPSDSLGCVFGQLWGSFMGFKGISLEMLNIDLLEEILLVIYGSDFVINI